ncbi:MAG: hypothetical protein AAF212_06565 [Verrucomicrobiota bacterium]
MNLNLRKTIVSSGFVAAAVLQVNAQTLIDYTFDGNTSNDIGPALQQVTNGVGSGGSSNLNTGVITTGTRPNGAGNSTYGFNSSSLVDVSTYAGFTATFVVDGISLAGNVSDLENNGLFFGVVSGTGATGTGGDSLFNNDPDAFGYVAGADSFTDNTVYQVGDFSGSNEGTGFGSASSSTPDNASYVDGFTVSISIFDDNSWSITSSGLSTELSDSGSLDTELFSYSDISGGVGLYVSLQGEGGGMIELSSASLAAIPEPSVVALVSGLVGAGLVLVRRIRKA